VSVRTICAGWLCLSIALAGAARAGDLVLVEEGAKPLVICASKADADAAEDLARYLKQISGAAFAVKTAEAAPETPAILVGAFGSQDAESLPGDSFLYRTGKEGTQLHLFGRTPRATRMAVFAFLEEQLGCRWWSHDEEEVPAQKTIRLAPLDVVRKAVFLQTDIRNNEAYSKDNGFSYKCRGMSTDEQTASHAMYSHLAAYGKENPDIYPFSKKTGKRAPNKIHHCYLHPGIAEEIAQALEKEIQKHRKNVRDVIYMSGMGDWYGGMCECPQCEAVYAEEAWERFPGKPLPGYSATLLRLINRVGEILEAKYPGVRVGTSAYMSLEAPPGKTVPRANVHIRVPHLRHCIIHGVDKCARNKAYYLDVKRWSELAPGRVYIWDYTVNFKENFLYPFPVVLAIADSIKLYARLGLAGMTLQGNYVSTGGDLVVLKNYVWRKLLWNPELDPVALVQEFCDGYYGPAAKPIFDYVMDLERCVQEQPDLVMNEFVELGDLRKYVLTPERCERLRGLLGQARQAAAGKDPYARRVEEVAVSLDAIDLFYDRPLVEHEGRLCQMCKNGPVYTYDRAAHMIENCRQSSFREWDAYMSYHQPFLVQQGGPLVTLKRGPLTVKVAPVQGLRIYQIEYDGKPLLRVPEDPKEEGYPLIAGAYEKVIPLWRVGRVVGTPTETSVEMFTTHESGSSAKGEATKRVELSEDGLIRITSEARTLQKREGYDKIHCLGIVEYAIPKGGEGVKVEVESQPGQWTAVEFPAQPPVKPAKTQKVDGKVVVVRPAVSAPAETAVKGPILAARVTLPHLGVVVEERYPEPGVQLRRASFGLNLHARWLQTSLDTDWQDLDKTKMKPWLQREIRIRPLAP